MGEKEHPADQIDKFRELARELEADEDEARFEERLRQIVSNPPQAKKPKADERP